MAANSFDKIDSFRRSARRDETLASWERKSIRDKSKTADGSKTQTISFGSARYECRKLELLVQKEGFEFVEEELRPSTTVLEDKVRHQLEKLREVAGQDADGMQVIIGCLSTIVMVESGGHFGSVRSAIDEFTKELNAVSESLSLASDESYIERQSRLFQQSFDSLYETYSNKYVLFHEGEVLYSADSLNDVAKVAYSERKVKDIFIKKVSPVRDTIDMLTPIVVESAKLA